MINIFKLLRAGFQWFSVVFICIGGATILFIGINFIAAHYLKSHASGPNALFSNILGARSAEGIRVLKRIFHTSDDTAAAERAQLSPSFEMHPSLHYMTARVNNVHYHLGLDGIRYDAGWSDDFVLNRLNARGGVYLFGGSTMMGHGVSGDETISWYMNNTEIKSDLTAFNFGSQAYDFQRAAEKLAYLLRIGYRPDKVVFLIGWNEILGNARSNMRWQDNVIYHGFSQNRGEIAYTPQTRGDYYVKLVHISENLPIIQLLRTPVCSESPKVARDPFVDGFDFKEGWCLFNDWEPYADRNKTQLQQQLLTSLRAHLSYINSLAVGFNFKAVVVLQPIGLFDSRNPFVTPKSKESTGYSFLESSLEKIRAEINAGQLEIIDGSVWLDKRDFDGFVDLDHYSPNSNKMLAKRLSELLR